MTDKTSEIEATLDLDGSGSKKGKWIAAVVAVAVIGGGAWWYIASQNSAGAISYRADEAVIGDVIVTVTATGTIDPLNQVEISSELSGTVMSVNADYNDLISAGQVLATLDTTQLEAQLEVMKASHAAATANLQSAAATLDEARDTYNQEVALEDRGLSTHSVMANAKASLARAEAAYAAALANRDLALANYESEQAELEKSKIFSPIDGVVLDRDVEVGQIVAASLEAPTLFLIAEDLSQMELLVDISEADIGIVAEGNQATFTVDAYDNVAFPAEITQLRFAANNDGDLVTYTAVLSVDNPDLKLRPGMTAVAEIVTASYEDVLTVPNAALRYTPTVAVAEDSNSGGIFGMMMPPGRSGSSSGATEELTSGSRTLWVLRDGQPVELAVVTGDSDGSRTVILEGDLAAGDAVIVAQMTGG